MQKNPVLVIVGPTASGKSALAAEVAYALNGVVLNCDSMQIYKDIPIIAAAPTETEKKLVEHRLFEIYDCDKRGNVVDWLNLCVAEIRKLWAEKRLPVVVGGTGFYAEALLKGVTPIPETPAEIRKQLQEHLSEVGLAALYAELQQKDAEIAAKLNPNDKTRIIRALEVIAATGIKVSEWYKKPLIQKLPEAHFVTVKIMPSLEVIAERCCLRLDKMVNELRVLNEIKRLLTLGIADDMPAMKALGVPELSLYIKGQLPLEEALNLAKLHTRQYAKRQRTWLKNKMPADIIFENVYEGQKDYLQQIFNVIKL
ncbi:MAG: tRNA (adenosine(37)-N6)-dimethylallyltransferase MiaA [Alphaproteobacteria bacterium]|nr:tRNA (adenosine(37)-N6)-dimethylallyltransferase MiaA [Alphaproteobacteria bacterium]